MSITNEREVNRIAEEFGIESFCRLVRQENKENSKAKTRNPNIPSYDKKTPGEVAFTFKQKYD